MTPFCIVHASDLHFAKNAKELGSVDLWTTSKRLTTRVWNLVSSLPHRATSQDADVAERFAEWLARNANGVNLLLMSGDLATTGDTDDLDAARAYLFNPPNPTVPRAHLDSNGQPTLGTLGMVNRIRTIPGNHDRFRGGMCWPGANAFDSYFPTPSAKEWTDEPVQVLFDEDHEGIRIVVIGADFTLRQGDTGEWATINNFPVPGWLGQGAAYRDAVDLLIELTDQARTPNSDCVVLWLIHFDPRPYPLVEDTLKLIHRNRLEQAVNAVKVDAVLCGHTHLASVNQTIGKSTPLFVCGTTTQLDIQWNPPLPPNNSFLTIKIDWINNAPILDVTIHSIKNGSFFPANP